MKNNICYCFFILLFSVYSCTGQHESRDSRILGSQATKLKLHSTCTGLVFCQIALLDSNIFVYELESSYIDPDVLLLMKFDGSDVYLNLTQLQAHWDLLFSFADSSGHHYSITVYDRDWKNNNGHAFAYSKHDVELLKLSAFGNERFALVKIYKLIEAFPEIGVMDAVFAFSSEYGFIGSYYQLPNHPEMFIEKKGDVKEELFKISHYTSSNIK